MDPGGPKDCSTGTLHGVVRPTLPAGHIPQSAGSVQLVRCNFPFGLAGPTGPPEGFLNVYRLLFPHHMEVAISCRACDNKLSVALWESKCMGELLRMFEASQPELTGGPL